MKMLRRLWWISIGAAVVYFFDPERGRLRREQVRRKLEGGGDATANGATSGSHGPISLDEELKDPLHEAATR
jgi:hypothetical protein